VADVTDATTGEEEHERMTLVEHLAELRSRLFKVIIAVVVGGVVCWAFYNQILEFLLQPYCDIAGGDCSLYVTDPLEGFAVRLKVAGYGGIALAMPVILWQLWRFITPGLYKHEKRMAVPFVVSAVNLFTLCATLASLTHPKPLCFPTHFTRIERGDRLSLERVELEVGADGARLARHLRQPPRPSGSCAGAGGARR